MAPASAPHVFSAKAETTSPAQLTIDFLESDWKWPGCLGYTPMPSAPDCYPPSGAGALWGKLESIGDDMYTVSNGQDGFEKPLDELVRTIGTFSAADPKQARADASALLEDRGEQVLLSEGAQGDTRNITTAIKEMAEDPSLFLVLSKFFGRDEGKILFGRDATTGAEYAGSGLDYGEPVSIVVHGPDQYSVENTALYKRVLFHQLLLYMLQRSGAPIQGSSGAAGIDMALAPLDDRFRFIDAIRDGAVHLSDWAGSSPFFSLSTLRAFSLQNSSAEGIGDSLLNTIKQGGFFQGAVDMVAQQLVDEKKASYTQGREIRVPIRGGFEIRFDADPALTTDLIDDGRNDPEKEALIIRTPNLSLFTDPGHIRTVLVPKYLSDTLVSDFALAVEEKIFSGQVPSEVIVQTTKFVYKNSRGASLSLALDFVKDLPPGAPDTFKDLRASVDAQNRPNTLPSIEIHTSDLLRFTDEQRIRDTLVRPGYIPDANVASVVQELKNALGNYELEQITLNTGEGDLAASGELALEVFDRDDGLSCTDVMDHRDDAALPRISIQTSLSGLEDIASSSVGNIEAQLSTMLVTPGYLTDAELATALDGLRPYIENPDEGRPVLSNIQIQDVVAEHAKNAAMLERAFRLADSVRTTECNAVCSDKTSNRGLEATFNLPEFRNAFISGTPTGQTANPTTSFVWKFVAAMAVDPAHPSTSAKGVMDSIIAQVKETCKARTAKK